MRKVQRFDMRGNTWPSEDGEIVSYKDYAALEKERDAECENGQKQCAELQKKLDAVLADNVMLKGFIDEECYTLGEAWTSNGQVTDAAQSVPETPATDAQLNAVRAEAIRDFWNDSLADVGHVLEEIGAYQDASEAAGIVHDELKERVEDFADQLRAETDTTSSQFESLAGGK